MTDFPFYNHWSIELTLPGQKITPVYIKTLSKKIINSLHLTVLSTHSHPFPKNNGFTQIFVLSESHLVLHSWPELSAVHIDLMTCTPSLDDISVRKFFQNLHPQNPPVFR